MIARLTRIATSLAAVIVLYWVYALAAVPFIEPAAAERSDSTASESDLASAAQHMQSASEQQARALSMWFRPGDWELTVPKVLETSQGMLLVKNYRSLGGGKVEICPCTMIFLPEGNFDNEEERQRRAIVVRSPQGAVLQFDSSFDIKQAKVGKPTAGKLIGPVTIRSDQRDAGPQDDLLIKTRDVDLSEQQLWTAQPVDFQLGPNYGHGRAMQIDMAPQGSRKGFRGMTMLQLSEHVEMHIHPSGNRGGFPGAARGPASAGSQPRPNPPVEIRCRGPFRFDFLKNLATFEDHVDVLRINPSGPSDQLDCHLLSIFFEPTVPKPGVAANEQTASNLQATRAEALGNPVMVHAPSNNVEARGQRIEYEFKSGAVTVRSDHEAVISQNGREIHSREVSFEPDAAGRIGRFMATGRGWLNGTSPQNPQQPIEARWTRRLHLRPHEGNHLLSIEGDAHLHMVGRGMLDAEEIHFWLKEAPAVGRGSPDKVEFTPDRLMAVGHVKIDSPQLTGSVGQLQAWFEQVKQLPTQVTAAKPIIDAHAPPSPGRAKLPLGPAQASADGAPRLGGLRPELRPRGSLALPIADAQAPAELLTAAPPSAQRGTPPEPIGPGTRSAPFSARPAAAPPAQPSTPLPPQSRFNVDGELLRVRAQVAGQVTHVSEVVVEHNVRVTETQLRTPGEQPLVMTGQQLHAVMPTPDAALVSIAGQPAYIEARGLTLTSDMIHMDRAKSSLWTDSHGLMTVPVDRDMDGKPVTVPQKLEITWQGNMHFDGQVARFYRQVLAQQGPRNMRTDLLEAFFSAPVTLGSSSSQTRPDVERIICRQGVYLENRTFEGPTLVSIDHLYAVDLNMHQPTGDLSGSGPGWLHSVRVDKGDRNFGIPGSQPQLHNSPLPAAGEGPGVRGPDTRTGSGPNQSPAGEQKLAYLGVRFERAIGGNLRRHEMVFENQVRTVYGPVPTWDSKLDPDRPETWGEQGVMMTSERLAVSEVPTGNAAEHSYELEATGNVVVENTMFTARSARLTYAQVKDLLILEGNGRTDARLFRQTRTGAVPSEASARKIFFWPSTNRVEVDEVKMLDLTNPPSAMPTKR